MAVIRSTNHQGLKIKFNAKIEPKKEQSIKVEIKRTPVIDGLIQPTVKIEPRKVKLVENN